jgi:Zn-dependent M28 family amino/carboxypeptidase
LARVLSQIPFDPTPCFIFFDGEESFGEWSASNGLFGSRYLVRSWKQRGDLYRVRAMILADMVGDKNLLIEAPPHSAPSLVKAIFDSSAELGCRSHFGYGATDILDDHVPFMAAGIPTIDLIDFDFGSAPHRNDYWHTDQDTLDKISPQSLDIVGRTILKALPKIVESTARSK